PRHDQVAAFVAVIGGRGGRRQASSKEDTSGALVVVGSLPDAPFSPRIMEAAAGFGESSPPTFASTAAANSESNCDVLSFCSSSLACDSVIGCDTHVAATAAVGNVSGLNGVRLSASVWARVGRCLFSR